MQFPLYDLTFNNDTWLIITIYRLTREKKNSKKIKLIVTFDTWWCIFQSEIFPVFFLHPKMIQLMLKCTICSQHFFGMTFIFVDARRSWINRSNFNENVFLFFKWRLTAFSSTEFIGLSFAHLFWWIWMSDCHVTVRRLSN